jgi:hypothetical protein
MALLGGQGSAVLAEDEVEPTREVSREAAVFEGSRLGHLTGYHETSGTSEGSGWHFQGALTGTGAYVGLTALIFLAPSAGTETFGWDIHGMVFPGELPEAPAYPEPAE